ncbi:MAG: hypothetical protein J2O49_01220 [Sciscionella sp.]|nr:hypothetical protein [Sciscionella sp.]
MKLAQEDEIDYHSDRKIKRTGVNQQQLRLGKIEGRSSKLHYVLPIVLPGLLQTENYLRVTSTEITGRADAQKRNAVNKLRLERQQILGCENKQFTFLLAEAAIRNMLLPAAAMAKQIDHLIELARAIRAARCGSGRRRDPQRRLRQDPTARPAGLSAVAY